MALEDEEYIPATELAKQYGVSMSTIRRRIAEGNLFPGAKKRTMDIGERWFIPRSETEHLSLENISPKLFQEQSEISSKSTNDDKDNRIESATKSLEDRVARLERLLIKVLDRLDEKSL